MIYLDQHAEPNEIARTLARTGTTKHASPIALSVVEERPQLIINNLMGVNDEI